ncbi:hypothetical protein HYU14_00805 [Candidatus Woesearchaeota archaeon]|nr:hypothetical protein [Candidatus Woesearchaeota archaeon]
MSFHNFGLWLKGLSIVKSFSAIGRESLLLMLFEIIKVFAAVAIFLLLSMSLRSGFHSIGISDDLMEDALNNLGVPSYQEKFIQEKVPEPSTFKNRFYFLIFNTGLKIVGSLLTLMAISSALNAWGWCIIQKKRCSWKFILRYMGLMALWVFSWLAGFLAITLNLKPNLIPWAAPIMLFLFIFFSFILFPTFAIRGNIFASLKQAFALGIRKFHIFFGNILWAYIVYQIGLILVISQSSFQRIILYLVPLMIILGFVWVKYFSLEVLKNAANR